MGGAILRGRERRGGGEAPRRDISPTEAQKSLCVYVYAYLYTHGKRYRLLKYTPFYQKKS